MTIRQPNNSYVILAGNGTQTAFSFPFASDRFEDDDVFVYVWNGTSEQWDKKTVTTHYTLGSNTVTFSTAPSAPPTGVTGNVLVIRKTDVDEDFPQADFQPGSSIRAQDLDNNQLQALRGIKELRDEKLSRFAEVDESTGTASNPKMYANLDMTGRNIENIGKAGSDDQVANREMVGDVIASDITGNTTQGVVLNKATGGSNSGDTMEISIADSSPSQKGSVIIEQATGEAVNVSYTSGTATIGVDKSTATQQGVVQISAPSVPNGNPITLTRPADGEVELTIADDSIDVQKIKGLDKAETSEYATTWANDDDQVATVGALAARHDVVVSTTQPTTAQPGKQWLNITPGNQEHKIYDGSGWRTVAVGQPFSPVTATIVRYVDATNGSDAADVTGFLPQQPLATIKRAIDLINSDSADGSLVLVAPGVYQETLPIQIQRKNVSIVGQALRSCFVQPTQATETNTMFECNSGTLLANMTFVGLKAGGTRGNSTYDSDATYGLPENQGWCAAFFNNAVIKKSPYVQNCTSFNDSSIDNSVKYDQTNLPAGGLGGDTTSAMSGGGILCDGSVPDTTSPLRSFVVDSFTQINLDGPGILVTNSGYAQLVSFFGTFCHYHAKALNGGQINLSNCTTDFGRYGLIADGRSNAKITGSSVGTTSAGATSITVDGLTLQNNFFSNQPGSTMVMEVGGESYQVLSATAVSSNTSTISIYRATDADPNTNLGFKAQISDNATVTFKLRSYISTGGHTFEYVGSGTDYSAHPDYGGQAVEANQVVELGGDGTSDDQIYNRGKVWQSSTDENGKFKVGDKFQVDQRLGTITLDGFTVSAEVISDTTPQLGGDLDLNSQDITGTGNINITGTATLNATSSLTLPVGTVAQRPGTAAAGMFRFNSDSNEFEGYNGTAWGAVGGADVGTDPQQIPLNQFLGKQAFVDEVGTVIPSASDPQRNKDINFEYVSDTSIKIRMRGADGTVRSTTLTLS